MTMRRLALFFAVLAILAEPAFAQTQPIRRAVADFPACTSPTDGVMVVVLDPVDASDCSTGGGTDSPHPCVCDGGATTWTATSGGSGVSDHGALTGLTDDDHPQYALLAGRSGSTVFNDLGADVDFRVEGDTVANLLFVDASTDRVGIGTNAPAQSLHVVGTNALLQRTGGPAGMIVDRTDGGVGSLVAGGTNMTLRYATSGALVMQSQPGADIRAGSSSGITAVASFAGDAPANSLNVASGGLALFGTGSFGSGTGVLSLANATTRPSTAPADAVILSSEDAAAGATNLYAYNEAGQRVRLTGIDRRLTTAVTKTTDTTHAAVTGLSLPVEAGKSYAFEARLYFDADATGGVKVSVWGSATATATITHIKVQGDGNPANTYASTLGIFGGTASDAGKTSGMIHIHGTITVNAAGTIEPWWSQNAATGSSTLKVGSTFHIREIS